MIQYIDKLTLNATTPDANTTSCKEHKLVGACMLGFNIIIYKVQLPLTL